jgi:hypothetical protein
LADVFEILQTEDNVVRIGEGGVGAMTIEEQKTMNENYNPHTQAVDILEQAIANGERFAYDIENPTVVMADLFRKEQKDDTQHKNNN